MQELWQPYRISPRSAAQHIDLSTTWELSYMDAPIGDLKELENRKDPFSTQIPNSVHWSLYKAGKLPHPYAHKNSTQYRWAEEKVWYYKKQLEIPSAAKGQLVLLSFDGVDYFSKVWVNGALIGEHEGMFGGPVIDISKLANYGDQNEIVVEVRAGNWGNKATDFEDLPRGSTGERDYSKRTGYNPRASGKIIKPWIISGGSGTEAFFSLGMWQGARIEILPNVHLERPFLTTRSMEGNEAQLHLSVEVLVDAMSLQFQLHPWGNSQIHHPGADGVIYTPHDEKISLVIELDSEGTTVFSKEVPLNLFKGRNWSEEDLTIPNPKLWNPTGLGDPNLYEVSVSLKKNGVVIDKISFDYGIRIIERIPTAGPRLFDRYENWQFIVNGRKIFVKGMNFTPADVLLDLTEERYRWELSAAKEMGVQMMRIWGGGLLETDAFYKVCNELGIMVWQDFPIGNQDTPDYPQDVWEAQVVQNIVRLRNHPSLVVWCGGNEFNPYSYGNAATIGVLERNLKIFDNTRLFVRSTPDDGSVHIYPDMDPTWYDKSYKYEAWVSETGMHSIPEAGLFYELVDNKEFSGLGKMWDVKFADTHPEFIHHFTEYGPGRVPRMLSRASHFDDMSDPSLESISEASQIGAGEWYQIVSEKMQGNYPVTAGLMPWVFKRHWPVIAIQMMDWFGQPVAPYYFLKRTYEKTHVAIDLERLLWRSGENIKLQTKITNSIGKIENAIVSVSVFDQDFNQLSKQEKVIEISEGASVTETSLGDFTISSETKDQFLFLIAELKNASGDLVSRSVYYPRVLSKLDDPNFYKEYINKPIPWVSLDKGPWLKPTVAKSSTKLNVELLSNEAHSETDNSLLIRVENIGKIPAFMTSIDIAGAKRIFYADDNYFWLAPGESREIAIRVKWRETKSGKNIFLNTKGWNTNEQSINLK
ncbi:sugar-binding domain-containing protein [uncultured Algoriphagus sp.]|uniref:glycoside hydrolase family 2 protein n=1 Tax=uncultured Algoriphagus sp. TaxID=417365 RepID=UPI0030EB8FED|tara:strand:- start:12255 stop:15035 length:2781 start_codon:yes stop_codon:yes gene_type:complete